MSNNNDPNQFDRFDDVQQNETGIFAEGQGALGDGLHDFDTCRTNQTPTGVEVEMRCRFCGRSTRLLIEYGELIAIGHNIAPQTAYGQQIGQAVGNPTPWAWSQVTHSWWPQIACSNCNSPCGPMFTPDEARKHVSNAVAQRWLDPGRAKNLADVAARVASAQRGP